MYNSNEFLHSAGVSRHMQATGETPSQKTSMKRRSCEVPLGDISSNNFKVSLNDISTLSEANFDCRSLRSIKSEDTRLRYYRPIDSRSVKNFRSSLADISTCSLSRPPSYDQLSRRSMIEGVDCQGVTSSSIEGVLWSDEEENEYFYHENVTTAWNEDKKIQQRWRTARDTYCKEKSSKKKQPSDSSTQKKKKYSFYDMLSFLDKTTDMNVDETLSEEQTRDSSLQSGNTDPQPSSIKNQVQEQSYAGTQRSTLGPQRMNQQDKLKKLKNQRGNSEFETELLQYIKSSELEIAKDDLAFYKSIQPTLNCFNSYQKLMFRTKVMNLLMEMTQQFPSLNYFNQQQSITSSDTNYDSMSPFGAGLSDQNMENNLEEVNETDRDGASATETGTLPLERKWHVVCCNK